MADGDIRGVNWSAVGMLIVVLLAVLAFVAGLVAVMYYAVQWLGLQAAIAWAAFAGLAALLIRIEHQRKREYERLWADRRRDLYLELLELLGKCSAGQDPVQAAQRHRQQFDRWSMRLSLLGSTEVLAAWERYRRIALFGVEFDEYDEEEDEDGDEDDGEDEYRDEEEEDQISAMESALVRLLVALRRDCGLATTGLTSLQLRDLLEAP